MTSPFVQFVQRRYENSRTAWRECRAEADHLAQRCSVLEHEVTEVRVYLGQLQGHYDLVVLTLADHARDLDRLRADIALRDHKLSRLRSSLATSIDDQASLKAERDLLLRDRNAQLD